MRNDTVPAFLAAGGIDADSLDTKVKQRDKDLGSEDFFDVVNHPQVRFGADAATLDGDTLTVRGRLVRAEDRR